MTFWRELWRKITKIFFPSSTDKELAEVLNSDDLLRRIIFRNPSYVSPDNTLSSFAFKLRSTENGLSVDIARLTTYEKSIVDKLNYRLYSVKAEYVRSIGLNCIHDPLPDNNAHALIVGEIKNSVSKKLSRAAIRIPFPD